MSGCDVCGDVNATWYKQFIYGMQTGVVLLCRAHAKSRRALGYILKPANK